MQGTELVQFRDQAERIRNYDSRHHGMHADHSRALVYVFYLPGTLHLEPRRRGSLYLRERKEVVYENLRDLNFEYKAGKLPDADYQSMKTSLEEEAAAVLAEISRLEQAAAMAAFHGADKKEQRFEGLHVASFGFSPSFWLSLSAIASAQTLSGTVKNATQASLPPETKSSC